MIDGVTLTSMSISKVNAQCILFTSPPSVCLVCVTTFSGSCLCHHLQWVLSVSELRVCLLCVTSHGVSSPCHNPGYIMPVSQPRVCLVFVTTCSVSNLCHSPRCLCHKSPYVVSVTHPTYPTLSGEIIPASTGLEMDES